jgi:restriction endonuclease BglII
VEFSTYDFRHAREILESRDSWSELSLAARSISREDILQVHGAFEAEGKRSPAGGQTSINRLFRERLAPSGWVEEPRLFPASQVALRKWKMDFIKARIGVEVSFNHAEAVPWTFTRLNIAGESDKVIPEHRVDVGVAFFATETLKRWARMDSAVGTFELAKAWLEMMRPIMPIPILVVGLSADGWAETDAFRGTRSFQKPASPTSVLPSPIG